ncbi:MAG: hypothetical protein IJ017_02390 [Oscillospiraceae bacterium]|nr:hypothetical protein [Oscillospiraceae bacterium]
MENSEFCTSNREKHIKLVGTAICEIFTIYTIVTMLCNREADRIALAFGTVVLAALPFLLEKLFRCRISLPLYIFALAYAIGPMLGNCWKLYYTLPGWDKLLHTTGGVMFVILGACLFDFLMRGQKHQTAKVIFSFCFSVAVAALWEFCEFGADTLLGMDMQYDTVVHGLNSYLLGDRVGVVGSISDIESITVNGVLLQTDGYIDIGLIDTMLDMLLETIGAVIACIIMWIDKGKHPLIKKV